VSSEHSGKGGDWESHDEEAGTDAWPPTAIVLFLIDMAEKKNYDPNIHLHTEVIKHARKAIDPTRTSA